MKSVLFLVSGGGGTLKFIHEAGPLLSEIKVAGVIADRKCGALDYAQKNKISAQLVEYSKSKPDALREAIQKSSADLVVTNFHKIIDTETLSLKPGKFLNLHYSLLPDFGGIIGMKTLEEAEKVKAKRVGATCHRVEEKVDSGKILGQAAIPVTWSENRKDLTNAVFRSACFCLANTILNQGTSSKKEKFASQSMFGLTVHYTPELVFDPNLFDNIFWSKVAT